MRSLILFCAMCGTAMAQDAERTIQSFVSRYCVECHGQDSPEAGIRLSGGTSQRSLLRSRESWLTAMSQVIDGKMPPEDAEQPSGAERAEFKHSLGDMIQDVDWQAFHNPGRLGLARLTAVEYRNSIRDLFGVDLLSGRLLGRDPEGNTGFTNDRDTLTFPLFAFDGYLSEAERAADAVRAYSLPAWSQTIEAEEALKRTADRSVELDRSKAAVALKGRNQPFQLNVEVPHSGLYRFSARLRVYDGEPLSAMSLVVNGRLEQRMIISGVDYHDASLNVFLRSGANVLSLGLDPDRAPILQPAVEPRTVPAEIAKEAKSRSFKPLLVPERLRADAEAKRAWDKLNRVLRGYLETQALAELLIKRGKTDFEQHALVDDTAASSLATFSPTKTPFNLAAGKVAVYLKVPQTELERQILTSHGFSHKRYQSSINRYKKAFRDSHPDRVRKQAGKIAIDRITLSNHGLSGTATREDLAGVFDGESFGDAKTTLQKVGRLAFGRRLSESELDALHGIYLQAFEQTQSHTEATRDALVGVLVSPPFLLRYNEQPNTEAEAKPISDFELAQRLARFLWLSIPDDELLTVAEQGRLRSTSVLLAQVDRMMADDRFYDVCRLFIQQWLNLEPLQRLEDAPGYSPPVVIAMQEEPAWLFHHIVSQNRPLTELITADYTFVNGVLAQHYGIDGVTSNAFLQVPLKDTRRGGLLAMAAPQTVTSGTRRKSPVNRGAWVVELILGQHLPPAPASVPELKANHKTRTIREELELHRSVKECAGCHSKIDPFGFALEHYDRLGRWQPMERGKPVNASTTLPDGTAINGLADLRDYIASERSDDFVSNVARRMFEFALGRKSSFTDEATLRRIVANVREHGDNAKVLVTEIIRSEAFLQERGLE
ncbi:MAG: DUF1592 domain-containing protein [Planctomycetota bacterium]